MEEQITGNAFYYMPYTAKIGFNNNSKDEMSVNDVSEQKWLLFIANGYSRYHGYISLVICTYGIIANSEYGYFKYERAAFSQVAYRLLASKITLASHNASVWLGVSLTFYRFIQTKNRRHIHRATRNMQTVVVVSIALLISVVSSFPNFLTNNIVEHTLTSNETIYIINATMPTSGGSRNIVDTNGLLYAIVELPQGILVLMRVFVSGLYENVYIPLGDFFDAIALLNCTVDVNDQLTTIPYDKRDDFSFSIVNIPLSLSTITCAAVLAVYVS
ncbi:uncharacterized protein LOC133193527 [Saccostrea echinata]|uniref:uncharacterized protein LOC133193527 n=1 Tax=Saccostrea echinata TaxID=191078 RepID=UPI002A82D855|nr:uncharacterized protein LOC133193527 [Saccostrea echinata]